MGSYQPVYDEQACEFPRFPNRRWGSGIWIFMILIFTALFLVSLGSIATNVVLIIKFIATDNTGFEPHTLDFQLFKNSRFAECSAQPPDPANCSAILNIINHSTGPDQDYVSRGYIPISTPGNWKDGIYYDWCTAANCFNGYTVVPSTARSGTIGLTTFGIWTNVNMLAVVYLFAFLKRNWALYRADSHECKRSLGEVGFIDGALLIYTLAGSIVWWWVNYAEFVQNPVPNTTLFIYAWAATWLVATNLHYHPYSCVLDRSPSLKRALSWLTSILAVVQWGSSIHVLAVGRKYIFETAGVHQGHDCTASFMRQGVGTAQCSAEKLCSDVALLANVPFYWDFMEHLINLISIFFFAILSVVALQPFIFATWSYYIRGEYSWSEQFKRRDIGPIAGPALAGTLGAVYTGVAASVAIILLGDTNREAPVVADPVCRAVHVGLSTWRYYLDLEPDSRALRLVKSFFNA